MRIFQKYTTIKTSPTIPFGDDQWSLHSACSPRQTGQISRPVLLEGKGGTPEQRRHFAMHLQCCKSTAPNVSLSCKANIPGQSYHPYRPIRQARRLSCPPWPTFRTLQHIFRRLPCLLLLAHLQLGLLLLPIEDLLL